MASIFTEILVQISFILWKKKFLLVNNIRELIVNTPFEVTLLVAKVIETKLKNLKKKLSLNNYLI